MDSGRLRGSGGASRSIGHVMQRGPPRPRPSSLPAMVDDLDAVLAQHRVGGHIALVAHDHTGGHGQVVGAVVPLLALGGPDVLVRGEHGDLVDLEDLGQGVPQAVVPGDGEAAPARRPA